MENKPGDAVTSDPIEPRFLNRIGKPRGVFQKNFKTYLYIGVAVLLFVAMLVSNATKKKSAPKRSDATTAPLVQDNTENNVAALHAQVKDDNQRLAQQQAQQQQDAALTSAGTPAQQGAAARLGQNGQVVPGGAGYGTYQGGQQQQNSAQTPQLTPEQQQAQQLAQKERERQYASRFESNLVFSAMPQQAGLSRQERGSGEETDRPTNLTEPGHAGPQSNLTEPGTRGEASTQPASYKRGAEVNVDAAVGQPYVVYEGLSLDTVLMNRLDGDAPGPVKVLVSDPVYSHDRQHVLIPEGTIVLGEGRKIGGAGFGQQRRIAVVFHRMIMPDGYSVDLDQFHGLDQIGEEGLKDKVNNHYLEVFGTSVALGVISGAGQITQGGSSVNSSGSQSFVNGVSAGVSQQATTILDKFIQIPPTITIREGHRVKVYFTQDLLLPAYTNHTIPQTF